MNDKIEWKNEKLKSGKKLYNEKVGSLGRDFYQGREWFSCDCGTEGIILEDDIDVVYEGDLKDDDKKHYYHTISLAFWEYGKNKSNSLGFKERLRFCWHVLKTGLPWADAVLLTSSEAEKFAKNILKRIEIVKIEESKINQSVDVSKKEF